MRRAGETLVGLKVVSLVARKADTQTGTGFAPLEAGLAGIILNSSGQECANLAGGTDRALVALLAVGLSTLETLVGHRVVEVSSDALAANTSITGLAGVDAREAGRLVLEVGSGLALGTDQFIAALTAGSTVRELIHAQDADALDIAESCCAGCAVVLASALYAVA